MFFYTYLGRIAMWSKKALLFPLLMFLLIFFIAVAVMKIVYGVRALVKLLWKSIEIGCKKIATQL